MSARQIAASDVSTAVVLGQSAAGSSHTGDTNEFVFATVTVPANKMGAKGVLRITTLWTVTNNANAKTPRIRLGGVSGTAFYSASVPNVQTVQLQTIIRNRDVTGSQVSHASSSGSFSTSTAAVVTGSIDTTAAQDIVISGQLGNSADTISLEAYLVEVIPGT